MDKFVGFNYDPLVKQFKSSYDFHFQVPAKLIVRVYGYSIGWFLWYAKLL